MEKAAEREARRLSPKVLLRMLQCLPIDLSHGKNTLSSTRQPSYDSSGTAPTLVLTNGVIVKKRLVENAGKRLVVKVFFGRTFSPLN